MYEHIEELADNLDEHAGSRAYFDHLSDDERFSIARQLTVARVQARNDGDHTTNAYRRAMVEKRCEFHYLCGQYGIDRDEARYMWRNVTGASI